MAQYISDSESLHIDDIEFMGNHSYVLVLRSSKTDIFRHGVRIPVYSNHQYFVLFKIMTEYIKLRRCAGAVESDPLFVSAKGFILRRCVLFQTSETFAALWDTILRSFMDTALFKKQYSRSSDQNSGLVVIGLLYKIHSH